MFFDNLNLPQLNGVKLEELERPLTKEECFETLKLSAKGKCPGSDGFTVEFYLHFWSILGEEMVESFNQALTYGHLNITQRQGTVLCKSNASEMREFRSLFTRTFQESSRESSSDNSRPFERNFPRTKNAISSNFRYETKFHDEKRPFTNSVPEISR